MPPTTTAKKKAAAPQDKYAATAWGSTEVGGVMDLEVPSGQLCLVRRPGVEGLLREGLLRDLDSFTALVQSEHIERVNKGKSSKQPQDRQQKKGAAQKEALDKIVSDPEKLANLMHTVDRVICHVVIKPEIKMTPNDVTNRKQGVIYADMVDLTDKMFIFNFVVGGSRDIARFLEEAGGDLGPVESVEDVAVEA